MKVVCWNVNSINMRLNLLLKLLEEENPDIVLLQETKIVNEKFPKESIGDLGYNVVFNGQKTFNGVAILSKLPIDEYNINLPGNPVPDHARYIEAVVSNKDGNSYRVISVYVPNGQDIESDKFIIKKSFFESLKTHLEQLMQYDEKLIVGGDFNVANEKIDVYNSEKLKNSICYHFEEQNRFREILNLGLYDSYRELHPEKQEFTWWDYRKNAFEHNLGLRIDYLLLSPESLNDLNNAGHLVKFRSETKPSDHVPVYCVL